ncbi:MAG: hypothetical protein Kow00114_39840 [Kiloniellaceae bacterium]
MGKQASRAAPPRVAVVGACHLDRKARAAAPYAVGASNPVAVTHCPGGVARNVAENLCRLGAEVRLATRLGADAEGEALLGSLAALPLDLAGVSRSETAPTAFHLIALQPDGEMLVAVADMRVYDEITPALLQGLPADFWDVDAIFADCNLPAETLGFLAGLRRESRRLAVNGVSPAKALRLRPLLGACDLLFVNRGEAAALLGSGLEGFDPRAAAGALRQAGAGAVAMTLGGAGLCLATQEETLMLENFDNRVVDITGAGDALAAAYLEARLRGERQPGPLAGRPRPPGAGMKQYLRILPEVRRALADGRPVVALESTIITHGMPAPRNLETARAVEAAVRAGGAVPATIALLDGRIAVGLDGEDLARLAGEKEVAKVSRADLPAVLAAGGARATTVAATMICADLAGIRVFATGGIGGVHRGAEQSFDVSADLQELGRTPVAVVSAGAKAILDLPKTLEVLETLGVPVIGYQTDDLPAFYSRTSGLKAPLRCDSAAEIAAVMAAKWELDLGGGLVIANPIPAEHEIPAEAIAGHIETALAEAAAQGIAGKAVTPFLLARLEQLTGGASLDANVALVVNNARLAAAIAVAYAGAERLAVPASHPRG